jgi:hypothetical protein
MGIGPCRHAIQRARLPLSGPRQRRYGGRVGVGRHRDLGAPMASRCRPPKQDAAATSKLPAARSLGADPGTRREPRRGVSIFARAARATEIESEGHNVFGRSDARKRDLSSTAVVPVQLARNHGPTHVVLAVMETGGQLDHRGGVRFLTDATRVARAPMRDVRMAPRAERFRRGVNLNHGPSTKTHTPNEPWCRPTRTERCSTEELPACRPNVRAAPVPDGPGGSSAHAHAQRPSA